MADKELIYEKVGKMVNAVRTVAGEYYQTVVPLFTTTDPENPNPEFKAFANTIIGNDIILNKFISTFQDVILYESFKIHTFENEFSRRFKKGSNPQRRATFETFVNPINPLQYDGEALDRILKLYKRDVKRVTYFRNREDLFPVSINREEVISAFQSMEAFYEWYEQQYIALQNSNAIVEFNDIKQCFNVNVASGALKTVNIHGMTSKEIQKLLRSTITKMTKPSSMFNNYINLDGATGDPVVTNTPAESLVFMPSADLLADLDVNVLAGAYNLEYAKVTENIITVDDWGFNVYDRVNQTILRHETSKIVGILCDEYILKFDEGLNQQLGALNGASLTQQLFWHVWQTIALRPFCNCLVLIDDGEEPEPPTPVDTFKLVNPGTQITIDNGEFTLSYEGTLPESFANFKCQTAVEGTGYSSNELLYNIKSFDQENKTITFEITGEYDGIRTNTENGSIVLLNISIYEIVDGFLTQLVDVPVKYSPQISNTNFDNINDVTVDKTVRINVNPTGVTPTPTIEDNSVIITLIDNIDNSVSTLTEELESDTDGYYFVIPANTAELNTSYTMFIEFSTSGKTFTYTFTTPAE